MNHESDITNQDVAGLETTLGRFDALKRDLVPDPQALRSALAGIPDETPAAPRRTVRIRHAVAALCTMALAFVLMFSPKAAAPSSLTQSLLAEEHDVDTSFIDMDGDADNGIAVNQADATIATLASDTVL